MRRDKMPTFVLAAAIVVGALVLAGVPLAALALPLILLACPLMMIFMMRGMDHGGGSSGQHSEHGAGCHGNHGSHDAKPEHDADRHEPSNPTGKDAVR